MEIIKARNLKYDYLKYDDNGQASESYTAVEEINLDIRPGQFISILGHNGSGKSTLAKHMNALLIPTEGTIWVDEMDTAMEPELWKIRQKAGMVFQNPDNQIIGTVVEEDVGFGPENLGIPTEGIWSRVNKSLEAVGMTPFRHRSPNKLSGGQKQRVAIAGVMAMQPKCIIMDEPTAMLDPNGRKEVLEAVYELNRKEGITVILITHYMEEVINSDRVFVMDQGHIVMQGTPREIFSRVEELKAYRLDVPQVTLLAYELKKAGYRVKIDDSDKSTGWKFSEQEILGIPTRIEIGPKDLEKNQVVVVRRDNREKIVVSLDEIAVKLREILEQEQQDMYNRANEFLQNHIDTAVTMDEMVEKFKANRGFVKACWCGDPECEGEVKYATGGAATRCLIEDEEMISDKCIWCGKPAKHMVYWGKSY